MPTLFREATNEALDAHAATFDLLADEATWADAKGEAADVAADMRPAAKLCVEKALAFLPKLKEGLAAAAAAATEEEEEEKLAADLFAL